MTKAENIAYPNSCWNKAKDDEPVFVLLGRDPDAPAAMLEWAQKRHDRDPFDKKALKISAEINKMANYCKRFKEESEWQTIKVYLRGKYVFVKVRELVSVSDHGVHVCEAMQISVRSLQCRITDQGKIPSWFTRGAEFAIYSLELKGNFIVSDALGSFSSNGEYQLTPKEVAK